MNKKVEATRECRICGTEKPLDKDYFPTANIAGNLRTVCIKCTRERAREKRKEYYAKNKEKELARKAKYESDNHDKVKEYQTNYRAKKRAEKIK